MLEDIDLCRYVPSIVEPWTVDRVEMSIADRRVDVWVAHPDGTHRPCPECGQSRFLFDHEEGRLWRHLDSCHFQTCLHARVPRVECPQHREIHVRVPWAEANPRFTTLFERWSIQVMQETDTAAAAELLGISWDEAWGIQERAVARGLAAKPPLALRQLGVDEKAVVSDEIVDIFSAAGLKEPELSIFLDEFLDEIRRLPYRSLALEVLRELLNDETREWSGRNLVLGRQFPEMLEVMTRKYQNRSIDAAQVFASSLDLVESMKDARNREALIGLTQEEAAFYWGLRYGDMTARDILGDPALREIAKQLVDLNSGKMSHLHP